MSDRDEDPPPLASVTLYLAVQDQLREYHCPGRMDPTPEAIAQLVRAEATIAQTVQMRRLVDSMGALLTLFDLARVGGQRASPERGALRLLLHVPEVESALSELRDALRAIGIPSAEVEPTT